MIVFYLSLPVFLVYLAYCEKKSRKKYDNLVKDVANKLIKKADDEKPIMLNVSQEKLIDKTIEEIERRKTFERGL